MRECFHHFLPSNSLLFFTIEYLFILRWIRCGIHSTYCLASFTLSSVYLETCRFLFMIIKIKNKGLSLIIVRLFLKGLKIIVKTKLDQNKQNRNC